jgi:hypothetical protein
MSSSTSLALLAVALASFTTGCQVAHPSRAFTPVTPVFMAEKAAAARDERLGNYEGAYVTAVGAGQLDRARLARNDFIAAGMAAIDESYFEFEKDFKSLISAKGSVVESISIGLSTAATALTPPMTKTVLSAIDTTIKGVNSAVDKNALREKTFELLNNQMRRERSLVEARIKGLVADDAGALLKYSLEDARRDLTHYYFAGSITNALTTLATVTATAADAARTHAANETTRAVTGARR